jgi:hypothetical protein
MVYRTLTPAGDVAPNRSVQGTDVPAENAIMQIHTTRSVWTMARWTCAAVIVAGVLALILGQLGASAANISG